MLLPDQFWNIDRFGCRGGVEYGMLSTSTDWEVSLNYSTSMDLSRATLFEIELGQINRGATLNWLSQYPSEDEILIPPLSNLEVVGEPRVESFQLKNAAVPTFVDVVVIPLRLSVNLRSKTIEELISNRKILHLATIENLIADTRREMSSFLNDEKSIDYACSDFYALRDSEIDRPASYLNNDVNFRSSQNIMMDIKVGTLEKQYLLHTARQYFKKGDGLASNTLALNLDKESLRILPIGDIIQYREQEAIADVRALIRTEINRLRKEIKSESLLSFLLDDDDAFSTLLPKHLDGMRLLPNESRVNKSSFQNRRSAKQACKFDDLLDDWLLVFPDAAEMLDKIDMLGRSVVILFILFIIL